MKRSAWAVRGAVSCMVLCGFAAADVPRTINYQGKITDLSGTPVADGAYTATFRIYDTDTGGTPLWDETQGVTLQGGVYSVLLGSATPLFLLFDRPYWLELEMTIGGETLLARRPLTSVGYALGVADAAISEGKIADGAVSAAKIADATITGNKIADGTLGPRTIGTAAVSASHIADGAITDADVSPSAAIADTKLATIATPGKVAASAVEDKFLRNDCSDATTGVISSAGLQAVGCYPLYARNTEEDAPSAAFMGGNVGIGTEEPGRALTIRGPEPYVLFERNGDYSWEIGMDCSSLPACSDFVLKSVSRNQVAVSVDALTGNVAVGADEPGAERLKVSGNASVSGALTVSGGISGFGAPVARNANQTYTAATDGFLIGTIRSRACHTNQQEIDAFVEINEKVRQQFYLLQTCPYQQHMPIMCPVRKGETYVFGTQWETSLVSLQWMPR